MLSIEDFFADLAIAFQQRIQVLHKFASAEPGKVELGKIPHKSHTPGSNPPENAELLP